MFKRLLTTAALATALPLQAAPAVDQQWALMATRMFPFVASVKAGAGQPSAALASVLDARRKRIDACSLAPKCLFLAATWTDAEMDAVAAAVPPSANRPALADDGIRAQVVRELRGLNAVLQTYGFGTQARYPMIDGPVEQTGGADFKALVADAIWLADAGKNDPAVRLDPSLALAIALVDASERHDAVAFEPLDAAHNAAPFALARTLDWKRYRYSAIIIPGVGPENPTISLSARGKLHLQLAARRFAQGDVAFIITSGAAVHPKGSHFVEAVEMRKALVERYGIPAERIVIEPYARHTTTNLRNATRRLHAMGAPLDKPTLIVANADQSRYITSPEFAARNPAELGYDPGTVGTRLSPYEVEFTPSLRSLRVDPWDPLDP
ncbi:YdcF family protein [Massilia phyllosphaerae]|uniref:YdcF family protein n=1 Tax=Massilia phyllosphaerae TaxID=3106034 RepID=UPI002B1CCA17|nr:YdcF family protein [Massilia sp. SGZ-792]